MGNYNDALLEQLADDGDGFYAYVNTLDEARRLFRDDLTSTLETVALDARAQVTFDRDASRRIGSSATRTGRSTTATSPTTPSTPGAIGAGHSVTALYALRLRENVGGRRSTRHGGHPLDRSRHGPPDRAPPRRPARRARSLVRPDRSALPLRCDRRRDGRGASPSEYAPGVTLREVADVAAREEESLPASEEVHAFLDLLGELEELPG